MQDLPALWTDLLRAVDLEKYSCTQVRGPRHWWNGPLDVEGLALSATQAAAIALSSLTGRSFTVTSERVAASFNSLAHLRVDGRQPEGFAPLSGFRRTADGWVRVHANYPHHAEALCSCLGVADDDQLRKVLISREARDVETQINTAGGIAAAVRTPEEWQASPMGAVAAEGPWIRFGPSTESHTSERHAWQATRDRSDAPLRGLRVLDMTRVIAGPSASRLLGALGADVLRIDPPRHPELLDQHIDTGFCKRSIELDIATAEGTATLRDLLDQANLALLGYRPGALDRFGLRPEVLTAERPGLKVVALDAWGGRGPWGRNRGFDSIVQAACGIAHIYRNTDAEPGSLPVQALDHATGMGLVAAAAALLASQQATWSRLSLARTAHELMKLPAKSATKASLDIPLRHIPASPYGPLSYVPPPLLLDGTGLEFAKAPVAYGSSAPEWEPRDGPTPPQF